MPLLLLLIVAFSAVHLSATEHKVADADVLLAPTTTATQNTTHAKESKESDNTSTHVRPNFIHTDTTYTSVDVSPEPEGGMTNFRKWIGDNFVYPQAAIDAEVKGVIQATFIVMGDGTLSDITIENGLGYGTEEATVNLLKKSPKWTPGLQKGRTVNVRFMLPIRLDLSAPSDTTTVIKKENFSLNKMASGDLESPVGPRPAEGMPAFRKWIADNFPFPQEAIDEGVKGTVEVSFIVETDGQITELKIERDLGYGTGEAAIALMKKAPKWLPLGGSCQRS